MGKRRWSQMTSFGGKWLESDDIVFKHPAITRADLLKQSRCLHPHSQTPNITLTKSANEEELLPPSSLFVFQNIKPPSEVFPALFCDSTADLTFDPVSARLSTGTQPKSVIQQNQNNKALTAGMKASSFCSVHPHTKQSVDLRGWSASLKSIRRRRFELPPSVWIPEKTENQTGFCYPVHTSHFHAYYARPAPWMLVWHRDGSQESDATLRILISIIV